jgi:hypothetical protein
VAVGFEFNPKHEGWQGKDLISFLQMPKPWPEPRGAGVKATAAQLLPTKPSFIK